MSKRGVTNPVPEPGIGTRPTRGTTRDKGVYGRTRGGHRMSDLPTREDAQRYWEHWNNIEMGGSPVVIIASAYADGELMTRKEFIDSLNMEAAAKQMDTIGWTLNPNEEPPAGWVEAESRAIVEAALGEDTDG